MRVNSGTPSFCCRRKADVPPAEPEQEGTPNGLPGVNHDAPAERPLAHRGTVGTVLRVYGPLKRRLQMDPAGAETPRTPAKGGRPVVLLRQEIGDVLRDARRQQGRTLREVSSVARVSLGYLSEVERGQKEASSELLASICGALDVPLSSVLRAVSQRVAAAESLAVGSVHVPDTVPDGLADALGDDVALRAAAGLVSAA